VKLKAFFDSTKCLSKCRLHQKLASGARKRKRDSSCFVTSDESLPDSLPGRAREECSEHREFDSSNFAGTGGSRSETRNFAKRRHRSLRTEGRSIEDRTDGSCEPKSIAQIAPLVSADEPSRCCQSGPVAGSARLLLSLVLPRLEFFDDPGCNVDEPGNPR